MIAILGAVVTAIIAATITIVSRRSISRLNAVPSIVLVLRFMISLHIGGDRVLDHHAGRLEPDAALQQPANARAAQQPLDAFVIGLAQLQIRDQLGHREHTAGMPEPGTDLRDQLRRGRAATGQGKGVGLVFAGGPASKN